MIDFDLIKNSCLKLSKKYDMTYCSDDFVQEFSLRFIEKRSSSFRNLLIDIKREQSKFCDLDSSYDKSYMPDIDNSIDCTLYLDSLDARSSTMLVMKCINEMTYKEIAKVHNVSHTTVKNTINSAIKKIKEKHNV